MDDTPKNTTRRPRFVRQDAYKKKKLDAVWRKPRGWDSKLRKQMHHQAIVDPGYGTPKAERGLHASGKAFVLVQTVEQAKTVDPKAQVAIVSGKLGVRKRIAILEALHKIKVLVVNFKDPEGYAKAKKDAFEARKKAKTAGVEKKAAKTKAEEKPKESIDDKLSDEEKKKLEKQEIDRLLTKKF